MPPRPIVFAIVAFWLAATSWQIQRDMWPNWFPPPDEPPPFAPDILDELKLSDANWQVFVDGKEVGSGSSEVKDLGNGSLEFNSILRFQKKPLFDFCTYLGSSNRITNKGQLLSMSFTAKVPFEIGVTARVEEGHLKSKLNFPGGSMDLKSVAVPENGIVFNPAHMGARIRQLRKGQTWRVPLLDVGTATLGAAGKLAKGIVGTELRACVDEEVINWAGQDVNCFRIDFTQQGKGVVASTWVRQKDGVVLKQRANMAGMVELLLVRINSGF